jgi:hypothetical protein
MLRPGGKNTLRGITAKSEMASSAVASATMMKSLALFPP